MNTIAATTAQTRRRGLLLSGFTALSSLFALISYTPLHFISVSTVQAIVLVVLGAVGALGSLLSLRPLLVGVGVVLILVGVIRLFTYGLISNGLLTGGVNAGALMAGLGTAYIAIWLSGRPAGSRMRNES